jgi:hypothetical protein
MTDEQTDIPSSDAAMIAAGKAYITATDMAQQLHGLFGRIRSLQHGPPWGTSEAGDAFGHIYHSGKGGADFLLAHGTEVTDAIKTSLANAATAIRDSTTVDDEHAASFFQVSTDTLNELTTGTNARKKLMEQ